MMLVLSRHVGDRIVIADSIEIAVVQIRGNKVRLGVTAPRQVSVRRHKARTRIEQVHDERKMTPD
jgi:carbon storage regulator